MTTIEAFELVLADKLELAKAKNADYGDSVAKLLDQFADNNIDPHLAIYIRLADKFHRFESLIFGRRQQWLDEKIDDTLTDLSNYIDLYMAWKLRRDG